MNGVLILDKPAGLTSHDVVSRVRRILGQRSVGHLGTLDPLATGVLPLVLGNFTRLAQFYLNSEKCYEGTVRFGFCTDTYDAEGDPTTERKHVKLDPEELEWAVARFRGMIQQEPPPFSAKKIKGVPAYKLARRQKEVHLSPVSVEIKELEVLGVDVDRMRFRARVSSGTYIRSVAHELGKAIGCGAHLEILRRTRVAEFTSADAHTLEELAKAAGKPDAPASAADDKPTPPVTAEALLEMFVHPRKLLPEMPSVSADEAAAVRIRTGGTVNLAEFSRSRQVKVFVGQRELIAIATRVAGTLFHARIVLSSS